MGGYWTGGSGQVPKKGGDVRGEGRGKIKKGRRGKRM